jgi:hypothetical protein
MQDSANLIAYEAVIASFPLYPWPSITVIAHSFTEVPVGVIDKVVLDAVHQAQCDPDYRILDEFVRRVGKMDSYVTNVSAYELVGSGVHDRLNLRPAPGRWHRPLRNSMLLPVDRGASWALTLAVDTEVSRYREHQGLKEFLGKVES